jgi:hypothetical protein
MSFDIRRLGRAEQLIGGGAIALFILMFFFKWYGGSASSSVGGFSVSNSLNGWHSFHNSRWIWLITIIVALGAVAVTSGQLKLHSPVQLSVVVAALGALSTILIVYRILHHPSGGVSGTIAGVHYSSSYGIKIGIWLGLIAAAAITYGGYLAMQAEGTSLGHVRDQASEAFSSFSGSAGGTAASPAGSAPPPPPASAAGTAEPPAPPLPPAAAPPLPPPAAPPLPPPAAPPPGAAPGGEGTPSA